MVGELTASYVYTGSVSGANLITAVGNVTLPATTDFLFIIPIANGNQVQIIKVVRAA